MYTETAETKTAKKAAPSTPARKFMFDLSFDDASVVHRAPERKPVLMKPEQIDALKKESRDEGFAAGREAGHDAQTAALGQTMVALEKSLNLVLDNLDTLRQEQDAQTRALALAVARKILPAFAARNGLGEIEAILDETIRQMAHEPRLVVRVNETQFDAVNEKAEAIATQRAYS
ncbi:MAG: hypothetical protein KGI97_08315, partial [Alphaproteobacteria bacterium]|nr:hypothetical protein [Alphaproteobacteria bacterium]